MTLPTQIQTETLRTAEDLPCLLSRLREVPSVLPRVDCAVTAYTIIDLMVPPNRIATIHTLRTNRQIFETVTSLDHLLGTDLTSLLEGERYPPKAFFLPPRVYRIDSDGSQWGLARYYFTACEPKVQVAAYVDYGPRCNMLQSYRIGGLKVTVEKCCRYRMRRNRCQPVVRKELRDGAHGN